MEATLSTVFFILTFLLIPFALLFYYLTGFAVNIPFYEVLFLSLSFVLRLRSLKFTRSLSSIFMLVVIGLLLFGVVALFGSLGKDWKGGIYFSSDSWKCSGETERRGFPFVETCTTKCGNNYTTFSPQSFLTPDELSCEPMYYIFWAEKANKAFYTVLFLAFSYLVTIFIEKQVQKRLVSNGN